MDRLYFYPSSLSCILCVGGMLAPYIRISLFAPEVDRAHDLLRYNLAAGMRERMIKKRGEKERESIAVRTPRFYSGPFGVTTSVETSFSVGSTDSGAKHAYDYGISDYQFVIACLLFDLSRRTGEPLALRRSDTPCSCKVS